MAPEVPVGCTGSRRAASTVLLQRIKNISPHRALGDRDIEERADGAMQFLGVRTRSSGPDCGGAARRLVSALTSVPLTLACHISHQISYAVFILPWKSKAHGPARKCSGRLECLTHNTTAMILPPLYPVSQILLESCSCQQDHSLHRLGLWRQGSPWP